MCLHLIAIINSLLLYSYRSFALGRLANSPLSSEFSQIYGGRPFFYLGDIPYPQIPLVRIRHSHLRSPAHACVPISRQDSGLNCSCPASPLTQTVDVDLKKALERIPRLSLYLSLSLSWLLAITMRSGGGGRQTFADVIASPLRQYISHRPTLLLSRRRVTWIIEGSQTLWHIN